MKILAIYDQSGCKYWRILFPVHLMPGIEVVVRYRCTEDDFIDTDIVFCNRSMPHNVEDIVKYREKYGFKLVVDFDDHFILDQGHYLYEHYKQNDLSNKMLKWIQAADAITVTHERLYNEIAPYNAATYIFPNAIARTDQFGINRKPSEVTRLFWCGTSTHKRDLALLVKPFEKINRTNVRFVIGGFVEGEQEWTEMANMYTNNGRYPHKVIPAMHVQKYYDMYSECDIALIPLVPNNFNANKSNLKILEAANVGAPVIVSRVDPYLGFPEELVNYVDSHRPWYWQITRLLKEKGWREEQGAQLQHYCSEHYNFEKINKVRKQLFDSLV